MRRLLPVLLLSACVVRYGPPPGGEPDARPAEPVSPPVDYTEVNERLETLLGNVEDIDQRDRLDAARALARRMDDADPRTQRLVLSYLRQIVAIEERVLPVAAPELYESEQAAFSAVASAIVEEELGEEPEAEPVNEEAPAPVDGLDAAGALQRAEDAALAGDLPRALSELEACRGQGCWAAVTTRWQALRDQHVDQQREQAGVLFLRARDEPDAVVRLQSLKEIRQRLADLLDRYPESPAADDLRRNLDQVQRDIEVAVAARDKAQAGGGAEPEAP